MQRVKSPDHNPLIFPSELTQDNQSELIRRIQNTLNKGAQIIRLDCSEIENATSSHIGLLWKIYDVCKSKGIRLILDNATTSLVRVLIILDLGELFGLEEFVDEINVLESHATRTEQTDSVYEKLVPLSQQASIEELEHFLEFLKSKKVPEMTLFELRTVVYEIMTNIIEHSGLTAEEHLKFTAKLNGKHIRLVFEDVGIEFDPTVFKGSSDLAELVTAAKDRKFKGFGLLMIRKLVDNIMYQRKESMINHLEIDKRWS